MPEKPLWYALKVGRSADTSPLDSPGGVDVPPARCEGWVRL